MMDPLKFLLTVLLAAFLFNEASALECYVCTNQSNNVEKCLNTIKTCEQGEDTCLTEIRWGSTPYWSEGAPKQYYVSKRCSTKSGCAATRKRYMPYCTHIWYEDWTCSECCRGDRCNYYIINGSTRVGTKFMAISMIGVVSHIIFYLSTKCQSLA